LLGRRLPTVHSDVQMCLSMLAAWIAVADERMLKWLQDGIEELTADVKWYSAINVVLASSTTDDEEAKA